MAEEDLLAMIAPQRDMIERTGGMDAKWPGHGWLLTHDFEGTVPLLIHVRGTHS
jgi:hypothetical protein